MAGADCISVALNGDKWRSSRGGGRMSHDLIGKSNRLGLTQKNGLMGRQAVEKAIESLHERKSDSFGLLSVSAGQSDQLHLDELC